MFIVCRCALGVRGVARYVRGAVWYTQVTARFDYICAFSRVWRDERVYRISYKHITYNKGCPSPMVL